MNELKLSHITKRYGGFIALDDVSFTLSNGTYALLGPNGAGKTTLINIIMGLIKQTSGSFSFNGKEHRANDKEYLSKLGFMPQYPRFYGGFTAYQLMEYMSALKGINDSGRIARLLEFVNLTDVKDKKIGTFSGGMRQRLAIAAALLSDPALLILDEPTAGLDPNERMRFRNTLSQISGERIILIATHIIPDIQSIADEVLILSNGKLKAKGSIESVCKPLDKKVWQISLESKSELDSITGSSKVSSVIRNDSTYTVRVVADEPPYDNAVTVTPTLEDLFYELCGTAEDDK